MNFRFHLPRVTEVAGEFLEWAGGQVHGMRLCKLVYLLDLINAGHPINKAAELNQLDETFAAA